MLIRFKFDERKAVEAAAHLAARDGKGGAIDRLRLIKMLYMADRTALHRLAAPITGDSPSSLPKGPVLDTVYDLIRDRDLPPGIGALWRDHFEACSGTAGDYPQYFVRLKKVPKNLALSTAEREILDEVFDTFAHLEPMQLVKDLHKALPEWEDPGGSSAPIAFETILQALGVTEDGIKQIRDQIAAESDLDRGLNLQ